MFRTHSDLYFAVVHTLELEKFGGFMCFEILKVLVATDDESDSKIYHSKALKAKQEFKNPDMTEN